MASQQQQQQDKLKQLGNTLVQKEEYEQAAKFYDRALELGSTSEAAAAIFSNRSLCNLNTKKYTEALQDAERAISLRPTWHRGYQRAAVACEKLDKHEEGLKHLEKCFELDEASKDDSALKKLKETFELNIIKNKAPSMTQDELKQIGNTFVKNQQYESAIAVYTLAIEKDAFCDEAVPILSNRSMAYFKIGKFKEAYEDGGFCCGIKPDWAKGFMRRGVAAEKLENWQIALESYDEYLKLDPKDEAGLKQSRNRVKEKYDDELEAVARKKKRLQDLDTQLTNEPNPIEKLESVFMELTLASSTMSTEGIQLVRKHGLPRLDALVDPLRVASGGSEWLLPEGLAKTKEIFTSHPKNTAVQTVLSLCLRSFANKPVVPLPTRTVAEQVSFLDFLLDIAEEEHYVRPEGYQCEVWLRAFCSHTRARPIRKDLIFVLFDRIKIAKRIFLSESASDGEFASLTLSSIFANHEDIFDDGDPADVCTQDIYECIQTCLQAGASLTQSNVLRQAIGSLRSLRVIELLIRYGADVNEDSNDDVEWLHRPLGAAFQRLRADIVRALMRNGAKLVERETPKEYLDMVRDHPLVTELYSPELFALCSEKFTNSVTEDTIQLLFECLTNQRLSFIAFHPNADSGCTICHSPLSMFMIRPQSTPNLILKMLRLQPALATLPVTSNLHQVQREGDFFIMPIASLFASVSPLSDFNTENGKIKPMENFDFYHKVITIALVEAGFDIYNHPMIQQKRKTDTLYESVMFFDFLPKVSAIDESNDRYLNKLRDVLVENTKKGKPLEKKNVFPLPKRGGRR